MIRTHGLTHIALAVRDVDRAFRFYEQVFGMVAIYRRADFLQAQTPGSRDVLVFEQDLQRAGKPGGVAHFGFRLVSPRSKGAALRDVKRAGGRVLRHGQFVPGEPYVIAVDPDGYEVEIWYELPTPVDPPASRRARPRARRRL
jgi:catechol 2,3-dioxygenase-like lactoylglutathione lyase family enzyme